MLVPLALPHSLVNACLSLASQEMYTIRFIEVRLRRSEILPPLLLDYTTPSTQSSHRALVLPGLVQNLLCLLPPFYYHVMCKFKAFLNT
jgi:hypothetical protein